MTMPIICAIDPGVSGGIAIAHDAQNIGIFPMPDDLAELREIIPFGAVVVIEKVPPYVGRNIPSSASFKLGKSCGYIEGFAQGRQHKIILVAPQVWQSGLGIGKMGKTQSQWKTDLKAEASRRWPHVTGITLKTSDALLILDYAIRNNITK